VEVKTDKNGKKKEKMNIRVKMMISGRVQGVGYRYFTKGQAEKMGLKGWVKNLDNGGVEAVFEGKEKQVRKMLEWCRKGSMLAKVDDIKITEEDCQREKDFVILK